MNVNPNCICPYLPCPVRGNCMACIEIQLKSTEPDFPNCLENKIEAKTGGCLPRKQPLHTLICEDYEGMSYQSAKVIADTVKAKKDALFCFSAGNTAIRTYEILCEMVKNGEVDFSEARFVQLDDWFDLEDRSEACQAFMHKHFYDPIGIRPEQIREFDLDAEDIEAECKAIDQYIIDAGQIDLMLLGIGMNGHVALNEPGELFDYGCHVVNLSDTTKNVGQKYFSEGAPLTRGITLGMRQVFDSKKVVLQAGTKAKAGIVAKLYATRPHIDMPATVMALVKDGLVILDKDAASEAEFVNEVIMA